MFSLLRAQGPRPCVARPHARGVPHGRDRPLDVGARARRMSETRQGTREAASTISGPRAARREYHTSLGEDVWESGSTARSPRGPARARSHAGGRSASREPPRAPAPRAGRDRRPQRRPLGKAQGGAWSAGRVTSSCFALAVARSSATMQGWGKEVGGARRGRARGGHRRAMVARAWTAERWAWTGVYLGRPTACGAARGLGGRRGVDGEDASRRGPLSSEAFG